ncbi:MAG: hypothetical protein GXO37_01615 [Chloroflexi bacterium]|nr:hypothetical protein [Chloroflexota bacterium]
MVPWKRWLGRVPGLVELDWYFRTRHRAEVHRMLRRIAPHLWQWAHWAAERGARAPRGRRIAIFAMLAPWVAHTTVLGLALRALGHQVTLGYLPYQDWSDRPPLWDVRKWDLNYRALLSQARAALQPVSLLRASADPVPAALEPALRALSRRDVEYTLQREGADESSPLYALRMQRNRRAAGVLLRWLRRLRPDALVVPNAAVLEFGVAYEVARYLGIRVVSYEFEYQKGHVWVAHDTPVMDLNTDDLWAAVHDRPLTPEQWQRLQALMTARRGGRTWGDHVRAWQKVGRAGAEALRQRLGLDERPVVLIATNVFGDSMTLDRQIFSQGMADWLADTLRFFARRPQVQVVVRVHPGEALLVPGGMSMLQVVRQTLPQPPAHIHIVPPDARLNTYDLVDLTSLGLVYTTTLGLEMAMDGVPVIVAGRVHYRGRGFTWDPDSWDAYYDLLERALHAPQSLALSRSQVDAARRYAYHFFFTYPRPYPWHIMFWEDTLTEWPFATALEQPAFRETFGLFAGEPLRWAQWAQAQAEGVPQPHPTS